MPKTLLAGVELGGTKCVCVLGTGPEDVREQVRIYTRQPEQTLAEIEAVLDGWKARHESIGALGLASFGPLDLDPGSATYGCITSTPKAGWRNCDVAMRLVKRLDVPMAVDTDVNAAALAEGRWGAAQGLEDFAYVTVGTGIGVGVIAGGRPLQGFTHPEVGHIRVPRMRGDDWPGSCAFHGDCLEGLASGPAIQARTGAGADALAVDHEAWKLVAHALGQLAHVLVLTAAPRRIIFGGGVMMAQGHLFARIRDELRSSLGGYIEAEEVEAGLDRYIVPPALGAAAGPMGALLLAGNALRGSLAGLRSERPLSAEPRENSR